MAVYISTVQNSGMTLVATMEKVVGGDRWNNATFAFEASPSFADSSITLTEGSAENLGTYSGSPTGSVGSPGWVRIRVHDTSLSNITIGVIDCYVESGNEVASPSPSLATTTQLTTVEGKIDTVDGVVDAIKLKTDTITDIYTAQIEFAKDTANTRDEYNVTWLKNGIPQTSGITSPTIQVVKRDATNLVASTAMTNSGSGVLIYNEATNRTTAGESYKVITVATIDAASRTFTKWIGRDA